MSEPVVLDTRNEVLDLEKFPNYLVRDKRAIAQYMNALIEKRSLLSIHLSPSTAFVSAVLDFTTDGGWIILDRSPDEALNDRVTQLEEVQCVTRLDGIRIQFPLSNLHRLPYDGFQALAAPLPTVVLRLQRRECYRLSVPVSNPATCRISVPAEGGARKTVTVRVLDISSGGVALIFAPDEFHAEPAATIEDCQLVLPEFEPSAIRLKVRNQFEIETRSGAKNIRLGCEFIDLPPKVATNIQRYIFKVERDRRALQTSG